MGCKESNQTKQGFRPYNAQLMPIILKFYMCQFHRKRTADCAHVKAVLHLYATNYDEYMNFTIILDHFYPTLIGLFAFRLEQIIDFVCFQV